MQYYKFLHKPQNTANLQLINLKMHTIRSRRQHSAGCLCPKAGLHPLLSCTASSPEITTAAMGEISLGLRSCAEPSRPAAFLHGSEPGC